MAANVALRYEMLTKASICQNRTTCTVQKKRMQKNL